MNQDQHNRLCDIILPRLADALTTLETLHEEEDLTAQEKEAIEFAAIHTEMALDCTKGAIFAD